MRFAMLVSLAVWVGCALNPPDLKTTPMGASTVVSLTFDDTFADQYQVAAIVAARGMHATFYINSGRIDVAGYMTHDQLRTIAHQGNEIAGHTVSHADLRTLAAAAERQQVCDDRGALLALGFSVTSFAYPFGSSNAASEKIVASCGYTSARGVGDLVTLTSCSECAYANPIPPVDAFNLKTPASVKSDTSLETLQSYVTQAEQHGGGWVPLVFHHVCDGCNALSISPDNLAEFLDWLVGREGTVVETVRNVTVP